MADARSGEGEESEEVCEIVDVPAGFISDVWQRFGFQEMRKEKRRQTQTICRRCRSLTNTHLWH